MMAAHTRGRPPPAMPQLVRITLHRQSRVLEAAFDDGSDFRLSFEYLRTHSPSAEVQGHGKGQGVLVAGQREVDITAVEPVGNYGLLLRFSDGHDSGIFGWTLLHELGVNQEANWQRYLARLEAAGMSRDPA